MFFASFPVIKAGQG